MSVEPVPAMRSTITDEADGLTIVIPARRVLPFLVFLPLWILGWAAGECFVAYTLATGRNQGGAPTLFMLFWLTFWTVGGVIAVTSWLWMMFGRERIVVGQGRLVVRYELFQFVLPREFDVQAIRNLRAGPNVYGNRGSQSAFGIAGMGSGAIAFDYGARTVRLGSGIDEAEGRMIVQRIKDRGAIPNLGE